MKSKHIAIVSPHFPPSNLVGAQRARFFGSHLQEFGWIPTIITVHESFYEEKLDPDLLALIPQNLAVRKSWAFSTKPLRLIGDIGLRGFLGMYRAISRCHQENKIDFLYITIPSNYASLLGIIFYYRYGIPYGIDYQDPWIDANPANKIKFSKAWWTQRVASILEPIALKKTVFISGVSETYYASVLQRNAWLSKQVRTQAIPFGVGKIEFDYLRKHPRDTHIFQKDEQFHMVYAGAMLPKAYSTLEQLLKAIASLIQNHPSLKSYFKLHFIGTGKSPDDTNGYNIKPYIEKYHLNSCVEEYPQRIAYLDVLNHLEKASAILILGSTEGHYMPSKIFQTMMSRKPLFALLHQNSPALPIIHQARAGQCLTFSESQPLDSLKLTSELLHFITHSKEISDNADWKFAERFSSKETTKILAAALDTIFNVPAEVK